MLKIQHNQTGKAVYVEGCDNLTQEEKASIASYVAIYFQSFDAGIYITRLEKKIENKFVIRDGKKLHYVEMSRDLERSYLYLSNENCYFSEAFKCADCKKNKPILKTGGTGYATLDNGEHICYTCCAIRDKAQMEKEGQITLYYCVSLDQDNFHVRNVTNWPGTLSFPVIKFSKGRHNIGREQINVWFRGYDNAIWHGRNIGDNQICRCKRTKYKSVEEIR